MATTIDFTAAPAFIKEWLTTSQKPSLVAIAGMTCSGKTTLAEKLRSMFTSQAIIVPLDHFFRGSTDPLLPRNSKGQMIFDLPASYNEEEFAGVIHRLLNGRPAIIPYFDKASAERVLEKYRQVGPAPIIIAEGLFTLNFLRSIKAAKLMVYVDADSEFCLQRRIQRDSEQFGISSEKVRRIFENKVMPYAYYVTLQKQKAHLIIEA